MHLLLINASDSPHKDLRRARSAMNAIIPTKTGAATAVGKVLPNLNGKLDGIALRVPVNCGSIVDLVCNVEHATSVEDVHDAIESSIKANNLQEIISFVRTLLSQTILLEEKSRLS